MLNYSNINNISSSFSTYSTLSFACGHSHLKSSYLPYMRPSAYMAVDQELYSLCLPIIRK